MATLCMSEASELTEREYSIRAEKLQKMEEELDKETLLRDISLSVRKSVESEERVILGSSSVMLSLVSDYFEAMFEGDSQRGESIELSAKITADGIRAIHALALGVLSKVQVSRDNLAALIAAAQYCDVPALSQLCEEFVNRFGFINDASVMARLIIDLDHLGFPHLVDEWMNKIPVLKMNDLFLDDCTTQMSSELFTSILQSDFLSLDEGEIWLKCVKWAEYQARIHDDDILTHLIKLKPLIRFPLMSEELLMKSVCPTKIISDEECMKIIRIKYQCLDDDSLFCSSEARSTPLPTSMQHMWDEENGIVEAYHTISDNGTVLTHKGGSTWVTAFIKGTIINQGSTVIEFEQMVDMSHVYGVFESMGKPCEGQILGFHEGMKGVGYFTYKGELCLPSERRMIGTITKKGDHIRMTVDFADPMHATLSFHINGQPLIKEDPIQLDSFLDLSHGLKFAVQTYDQRQVRIHWLCVEQEKSMSISDLD